MSTAEKIEVLQAELDKALAEILQLKRAQQHQGNPAAWQDPDNESRMCTADHKAYVLSRGGPAAIALSTLTKPLYTHADPGEVAEIKAHNAELMGEVDTLRAKLTEAHTLLSEIEGCPWVVEEATIPKAGIEAAPQQVVGTMHMGLMRLRKIRTFLSASAKLQQKAPD